MLAVRTQAIDGARTCTLLDSQHCRLLPFQSRSALGTYPDRPSAFSQRTAYTSSRPWKRLRNKAMRCSAFKKGVCGLDRALVVTGIPAVNCAAGIGMPCSCKRYRRRTFSSRNRCISARADCRSRSVGFRFVPVKPLSPSTICDSIRNNLTVCEPVSCRVRRFVY